VREEVRLLGRAGGQVYEFYKPITKTLILGERRYVGKKNCNTREQ